MFQNRIPRLYAAMRSAFVAVVSLPWSSRLSQCLTTASYTGTGFAIADKFRGKSNNRIGLHSRQSHHDTKTNSSALVLRHSHPTLLGVSTGIESGCQHFDSTRMSCHTTHHRIAQQHAVHFQPFRLLWQPCCCQWWRIQYWFWCHNASGFARRATNLHQEIIQNQLLPLKMPTLQTLTQAQILYLVGATTQVPAWAICMRTGSSQHRTNRSSSFPNRLDDLAQVFEVAADGPRNKLHLSVNRLVRSCL